MTSDASAVRNTAIAVQPRSMRFPFEELHGKRFFDNNALKSAFFTALSATFPPGEHEFIESVRLYRDKVTDPQLNEQIRGFIGQEGQHSHQHREVNRQLNRVGFDAIRLENHLQKDIRRLHSKAGRRFRLAMTVGMEHLTAIMAAHVLKYPQQFDSLAPSIRDLFFWHAVEEIEHKAVAFDVYQHCVGDRKFLRKTLRLATVLFSIRITLYTACLLWWSRTWPTWREWKGFGSFLFGAKGLIRGIRKTYMEFYQDDFHPWDQDNRELIERWKRDYYNPAFDRNSPQFQGSATAVATSSSGG